MRILEEDRLQRSNQWPKAFMVTLRYKHHEHDQDGIRTGFWRSNPRSTSLDNNSNNNQRQRHLQQNRTSKSSSSFVIFILGCMVFMNSVSSASGLRCYVCGGSTGRECEEIVTRRWSPYVRPRPVLTSDGKRQWEECNDLINNKGCIKQVVNGGKTKYY